MACMEWNCTEYWQEVINPSNGRVLAKFKDYAEAEDYAAGKPVRIQSTPCPYFEMNNDHVKACPMCGGKVIGHFDEPLESFVEEGECENQD